MEAMRLDADYAAHAKVDWLESLLRRRDFVPLDSVLQSIGSGHTPYQHDVSQGEIGFVTVECIDALQLNEESLKRITQEQYNSEFKGKRLTDGSVVCTIKRRICKAYPFLEAPNPPLAFNQDVALLVPNDEVKPAYLAAYLSCSVGQRFADRQKTEQMNPYISVENLRTLPVCIFSDTFQDAITEVFRKAEATKAECITLYQKAGSRLLYELGLLDWQPPEPLTYECRASEAFATGRLDSEYFSPKYESLEAFLNQRFTVERIAQWGKVLKGNSVKYTDDSQGVPVIRSGDLTDIEDNQKFLRALPDQEMFLLKPNDILISSIGFGSIGKVQVFDKQGKYATVSEVTIIRQKRVNSYFLHFYLRSLAGQIQINRYITGATGQLHLYPKDVGAILVPLVSQELERKLEELFKHARRLKAEAKRLLEKAKRGVEIAIEESEAAAMTFLEAGSLKE